MTHSLLHLAASGAMPIMFAICAAGTVGLIAYGVGQLVLSGTGNKLGDRLRGGKGQAVAITKEKPSAATHIKALFQKVAKPFLPEDGGALGNLRGKMIAAGIYSPSAVHVFIGFRVAGLMGGAILGLLLGSIFGKFALFIAVFGFIGYFLPSFWLKNKISGNQKELQFGLPDALDLLVVCVEAGLTIDAAMQRVAEELSVAHPAIAREFGIMNMETRIGIGRSDALKNLGQRTQNPPLQGLAAMLVQAERFGTSVSTALHVQADSLRQQRHFKAEEKAAKATVKLNFPLVLFIFPATFIVLLGPPVLGFLSGMSQAQ
ncbi:MAG: type II secretion system F family protein [Planctomycetota bacterium]